MNFKLPSSYYNPLSLMGTGLALISLLMMLFLTIIGFLYAESSAYLGLFVFIVLPVFLIIGLLIIPVGMWIRIRKRKKMAPEDRIQKWPVVDLNQPRYRNAFVIFSIGTLFFLLLSGIGSYEAFHYTESVRFCGTVCHEVMKPEYTAYQNSPHARVACVDCHVGSGADWYMRSKLSGLRQVYAVLTDNFNRPIETPIQDLRPAQETCETCHWPQKFYSRQLRQTRHYLTDSLNSEWDISLQMKIGPEHSALGLSEGIHWHINPDVKIEYIPRLKNREDIPWVKYTNLATGEVVVYQDQYDPLEEERVASSESRLMDCMDCHNRPSHHYYTPQEFIDQAITAGNIPGDLPFVKKIAMELFVDPYDHSDTAIQYIRERTLGFYAEELPAVLETRRNDVDKAINGIIAAFSTNIFPEMGASWDTYTSHIGHKTYNGCFRCHNDQHQSEDGRVISMDCNLCHTIVRQGPPGLEQLAAFNSALDFVHPKELEDGWEGELCSDCHRYLY
jgi:hypothetical protein